MEWNFLGRGNQIKLKNSYFYFYFHFFSTQPNDAIKFTRIISISSSSSYDCTIKSKLLYYYYYFFCARQDSIRILTFIIILIKFINKIFHEFSAYI